MPNIHKITGITFWGKETICGTSVDKESDDSSSQVWENVTCYFCKTSDAFKKWHYANSRRKTKPKRLFR
jgi:hypothetical protein